MRSIFTHALVTVLYGTGYKKVSMQYEVTFIVDPVLADQDLKNVISTYEDQLKTENCKIIHTDNIGLRQLAYPIAKRNTGVYVCIEYQSDSGEVIDKMELALRRDERIMRFLTIKLDKYGVQYNEDKRNGVISPYKIASEKKRKEAEKASAAEQEIKEKEEKEIKEKAKIAAAAKKVIEKKSEEEE